MPWLPPGRRQTNQWAFSAANVVRVSCATSRDSWLDGGLRPHAGLTFLLQPVAFALDVDGVGVVQQTIENRAGDHVVLKDRSPLAVALVGGQNHRAPLVAFADQLEQAGGRLPVQTAVADFIEDQETALAQMGHLPAHAILRLRLYQAVEQIRQTDEVNTEAVTNGFHAQRDRQVSLTNPGRPQKHGVLVALQKTQTRQFADLLLVDRGGEFEIELLQPLGVR